MSAVMQGDEGMHVHGLLRVVGQKGRQPRILGQGQDKKDLVNGIVNRAGVLFRTRMTETLIGRVREMGAFREYQSVPKMGSLNHIDLGGILARARCDGSCLASAQVPRGKVG
jgi:hypothetical protein